MEKIFIKNRKNQKLAVVIEKSKNQKGLSFVMHGLGGYKEQKNIRTMTQAFLDNDYTVVTFDTANTFGESDGCYDDATVTNYYEDLEDVLDWSKSQAWYQEPFCLTGHSLGGISVALFAEKFPWKVKALAPIATVVSGKLSAEKERTPEDKKEFNNWKKYGYKEVSSNSKPGMNGKLKWSHMEDRMRYDLLLEVGKLTMPVLLIVGTKDTSTPVDQQKILFEALPIGAKELHVIDGAPHTIRESEHLDILYGFFDKWIKGLK